MQVGTEDMIVTRDDNGDLHALHNVCRHRGAEVVVEDCGTARRLMCPYHLWSYDLTGALKVAHGMPKDMALSDFPLKSRTVREWNGLVFVVPDEDGRDNSEFVPFARKPSEFAKMRLEEAKVVHTEVYDIAANWKKCGRTSSSATTARTTTRSSWRPSICAPSTTRTGRPASTVSRKVCAR